MGESAAYRDFAQTELTERVFWLIGLRWLAAAGVVSLSCGAAWVVGVPVHLPALLAVGFGIAAYNGLFLGWASRLARRSGTGSIGHRAANALAHAQIGVDLATLGVLLHYVGGVQNPLATLFTLHMIIASILLSRRAAFAHASLAILIICAVTFLEQTGVLRHYDLGLLRSEVHAGAGSLPLWRTKYIWGIVGTYAATLYLLVYMGTSIMGRLRRREGEVKRLADALSEKADQISTAYDELRETQQLQTSYMRKTSHELRAPLAAVITMLDPIVQGLAGEVPAGQLRTLQRVRSKLDDLLSLTNDFLALLRSRAPRLQVSFEPVAFDHVVRDAVELFEPRAEAAGVKLRLELPSYLPCMAGDAETLVQLVVNLVSNAVKYTPAGGQVAVAVEHRDGHLVLTVSDSGIGIPAEDLPRLFTEFFRTARSRKLSVGGTGLGLAIVRSVVDAHGGTTEVQSEVDRGTTFTVTLPLVPPGAGDAPPAECPVE